MCTCACMELRIATELVHVVYESAWSKIASIEGNRKPVSNPKNGKQHGQRKIFERLSNP